MQDTVANFPDQAYAGKPHYTAQLPTTVLTRLASESIPFGFGVSLLTTGELAPGDQEIELPNLATDITSPAVFMGVAVADVSMEDVNGVATYVHEDAVPCMQKGQVWVETQAAITDLSVLVYCGIATAAGGRGSFDMAAGVGYSVVPNAKWRAYALVGAVHLGLVQLDL